AGHVQVQEDQARARRIGRFGVLTKPTQVVHQLDAVFHETEVIVQMGLFDRDLEHEAVGGVVVSHQNRDRFSVLFHKRLFCISTGWKRLSSAHLRPSRSHYSSWPRAMMPDRGLECKRDEADWKKCRAPARCGGFA